MNGINIWFISLLITLTTVLLLCFLDIIDSKYAEMADELAMELRGKDFYDLSKDEQIWIWKLAEQDVDSELKKRHEKKAPKVS